MPAVCHPRCGIAEANPAAEAVLDVPACLARVRDNDEEAARLLVRHLQPLVTKIVRSHLPRRTEEEDLAQMVFVKVFKHLDQFSGQVPFEHWVSRIAVNTCLNELRAERCRPELRWADLSPEQAEVISKVVVNESEPDMTEQIAARDLARTMLETLPAKDRLLLTWLDLEGLSVEEVRQRTGWGASRIKVRAFRARRKLRKEFERLIRQVRS